MEVMTYAERFGHHLLVDLIRYFLFCGIPFLIFYVLFKSPMFRFKIQQKFPGFKHIRREILYSLLSMFIFTVTGTLVFYAQRHGYTQIYTDFHQYSIGYFIFSVFLFIFAHDAYFYWSHRLMHHKKIYRHVHLVHHQSTNPTPWAAFAFHPFEAVAQVLILPIMVFSVPLHPLAILIWALYQLALNVGGHLGFELFRSGFTTRAVSKWHNTSTHHNMHHKYVNCNYGLYFNIWDRMMGTNHTRYSEEYEKVCARRKSLTLGESKKQPVPQEVSAM